MAQDLSDSSLVIPAERAPLRAREVTERIKGYIAEKHLRPGDPLPSEAELCEALAASRSSVREAIKTLSALDIVDVRHGRGTYVGRLSLNALVEGLAFRAKLSSRDDFSAMSELVAVRQLIDQGLAGAIIEIFDDPLRESLEAVVEQMRQRCERGETFLDEDRRFHLMLMEPVGNHLVSQLTAAFWDVHMLIAPRFEVSLAESRATVDAHTEIIKAAARGDEVQFGQAIEAHYAPVRQQIELHLSQLDKPERS